MFKQMKKSRQALSISECNSILAKNNYGVLSLLDDNGYTYGVPLNYFVGNNKIYFHGLKIGAKVDAIKHHNKVSFTVVHQSTIVQSEFTTYFISVIAFGIIDIIDDKDEIMMAIHGIAKQCCPDQTLEAIDKNIEQYNKGMSIFSLRIEHLSGKRATELVPK